MLLDVSEERQWGLVLTGMVKLQENAGVALSKGKSGVGVVWLQRHVLLPSV